VEQTDAVIEYYTFYTECRKLALNVIFYSSVGTPSIIEYSKTALGGAHFLHRVEEPVGLSAMAAPINLFPACVPNSDRRS